MDMIEKLGQKQNVKELIQETIKGDLSDIRHEQDLMRKECMNLRQSMKMFAQEHLDLVQMVMAHQGYLSMLQKKQQELKSKIPLSSLPLFLGQKDNNYYMSAETTTAASPSPTVTDQMMNIFDKFVGSCKEQILSLNAKESDSKNPRSSYAHTTEKDLGDIAKPDLQSGPTAVHESMSTKASKLKRRKKGGSKSVHRKASLDYLKGAEEERKKGTKDAVTIITPTTTATQSNPSPAGKSKSENHPLPRTNPAPITTTPTVALTPELKTKRVQTNPAYSMEDDARSSTQRPDPTDTWKAPKYTERRRDQNRPMEKETVSRLFNLLDELKALSSANNNKTTGEIADAPGVISSTPEEKSNRLGLEPEDETYKNLGQWKQKIKDISA